MTTARTKEGRQTNPARSAARLAAVQALYQLEMTPDAKPAKLVEEFHAHRLGRKIEGFQFVDADRDFFGDLVLGVSARRSDLDEQLSQKLTKGWTLNRLDKTLAATLRAGLYELLARPDIPVAVVINEYVDIAKAFHGGQESGFVNGILDRLARAVRGGEM